MSPRKNVIKIQVIDEDDISDTPAPARKKKEAIAKKTKKADLAIKPEKAVAKKAIKKLTTGKSVKASTDLISEIKEPEEMELKKSVNLLKRLSIVKPQEKKVDAVKLEATETETVPEPEPEEGLESADEAEEAALTEKSAVGKKADSGKNFEQILEEKGQKINDVIKESISVEKQELEESLTKVKKMTGSGRSIKLYRRIAYFFIALTLILVLAVTYYSVVKVEITLIPDQERISNNLIFDINDQDKKPESTSNSVLGIVKEIEVSEQKDYVPTGEEIIGEEVVGDIVIFNNYSKNQPLVASTRLLTSEGKLYRLKNTVNVPSGGQIEAKVYADVPDEDMVVPATKFSIPGLWAGLQDKIFAESKAPTVYQKKINRYVVAADLESSVRDLKQLLLVKAKEEVNATYKDYSQILYKIDENTIKSELEAKTGDEIDSFPATMSAKVVVVAFDNGKAIDLAKQKFISSLPVSKELISFEDDKVMYSLNSFDVGNGTAAINAQFSGKVSLKDDSQIIQLDKILGLNDSQLNAYLSEVDGIAGFEVKYRPTFIKRVPNLIDRIDVLIKR